MRTSARRAAACLIAFVEPLLHESLSRQVDTGGQRHRLAFDVEVRGEPGVAGLRDVLVDPTQARLQRQQGLPLDMAPCI
jgi:hypothetical protein